MEQAPKARCVNCRSDVLVPDSYAHGDHIKCGVCGTSHKVSRGDVLRLVVADVGPLREALRENQLLVDRLQDELRGARQSLGLGANGIGLGVIYALWQLGLHGRDLGRDLLFETLGVMLVTGILLELANYLFLSKRAKITRLSAGLAEAKAQGRQLQQKLREASKA